MTTVKEDCLIHHLGEVLTTSVQIHALESLLRQSNLTASWLFELARVQGVVDQVRDNLTRIRTLGNPSDLVPEYLRLAEDYKARRLSRMAQLQKDLQDFAARANDQGLSYLVIKGAALHALYPVDSIRIFSDIDLVISPDNVWEAMELLQQMGFRTKRIRLENHTGALQHRRGTWGRYGIAEFFAPHSDHVSFDMHLGGFPGCGDILLEADLWRRFRHLPLSTTVAPVPSPEDQILIICAHISRHGYARVRDLNDLKALVYHSGELDADYLWRKAESNALTTILDTLLAYRDLPQLPARKPRSCSINKTPLERWKTAFLFHSGKKNTHFHGHRQLIYSRLIQSAFLYDAYRKKEGLPKSIVETLRSSYYLFQNGRPYRLWKHRWVRSFHRHPRVVIVPLTPCDASDTQGWVVRSLDLAAIFAYCTAEGISAQRISDCLLVINPGQEMELILTPVGIYSQSSYDGSLARDTLQALCRQASHIVETVPTALVKVFRQSA
jgi:hypothetical protein